MDPRQSIENEFEAVDSLATYDVEDTLEAVERDQNVPNLPRIRKMYWRDVTNPFDFYPESEFKLRYRFCKGTVLNCILPEIQNNLSKLIASKRGLPVTPEVQVLIALRFYATGDFQVVCGDHLYVSQPTVSRIVKRVSASLAALLPKFISFPSTQSRKLEVMEKFKQLPFTRNSYEYPGLNNIIGAIDCTHVKIRRPRNVNHSELYRNRKGYFSINVQVVVGPEMEILDIVARWPGSAHDSRIFRSSRLHSTLETGRLHGILVGDSAYRSTRYMLCPFIEANTPARQHYNYVHVRTRNVVERFFGVWKRRFACLQRGLANKLGTNADIIVACAVLHNIAQKAGDPYENGNENELAELHTLGDIPVRATRNSAEGLALRNMIVNTFYRRIK